MDTPPNSYLFADGVRAPEIDGCMREMSLEIILELDGEGSVASGAAVFDNYFSGHII